MASGIRAPKTRSWRDVTLEDIVKKIAGEHGLKPRVSDSLKSVFYKYLAQTAESDLNLISRLAKDLDAVAKAAGGYLIVAKRGDGKAADGSDLPVITLTRSQMTGGLMGGHPTRQIRKRHRRMGRAKHRQNPKGHSR